MFEKLSQALRGNQNAAGPHKKRVQAAVSKVVTKIKGAPPPSKIGKAIKTIGGSVRDGAVLGGAIGATYGKKISNGVAKSMGMKAVENIGLKTAGRYAMRGAVGGLITAPLAIGAEAYLAKVERDKTIAGKIGNARRKTKDVIRKVAAKVKDR